MIHPPPGFKKECLDTVCIVAIVKDEDKFLDEWLIYHKLIGIDHFIIYDDSQDSSLDAFLIPHLDFITIIPWWKLRDRQQRGNQIKAYNHALNNYLDSFEWVIFLDADEFIVLNEHSKVIDLLSHFKEYNAVSLNWLIFGHNGHYDEPSRLVTTSFIRRMENPSEEVKTFSRTYAIKEILHPHYCELKNGLRTSAVKEERSEINLIAHVNHYKCRSFLNWMKRTTRGDVNFSKQHCPDEHLWRIDDEACLKEFVTNIAFNKNEFVDLTLYKYRFAIQEKLVKLKKNPPLLDLNEDQHLKEEVCDFLNIAAQKLIIKASQCEGIGLKNGRAGIALFLFIYSRYSSNVEYEMIANSIIDQISEDLTATTAIDFANGLTGFGSLIEFLVSEGFLQVDTNIILSDIDELLHYYLVTEDSKSIGLSDGVTGIGMYYASRLKNPINNNDHVRESSNLNIINELVKLLDTTYDTYYDINSVIVFLAEAYHFIDDKVQVLYYLGYAADKVETMLAEDSFFGVNINVSHLLNTIVSLFKTTEITEDKKFAALARQLLSNYSYIIDPYPYKGEDVIQCLTYMQLSRYTNENRWLNLVISNTNDTLLELNSQSVKEQNYSLENGWTGLGMIYLSMISYNGTNWFKLNSNIVYNDSTK